MSIKLFIWTVVIVIILIVVIGSWCRKQDKEARRKRGEKL